MLKPTRKPTPVVTSPTMTMSSASAKPRPASTAQSEIGSDRSRS